MKTTGAQTYGDAVTLGADTTLTGVGLTLSSTVDGAKSLTVNDSGTTTFSGAVGGTTALVSLTTDAGGTTAIDGGSVKTTGAQTYGDAVTLGADTTLTSSSGTVTLNGVTGSGKSLTVTGDADVQQVISGLSTLQVSGTTRLSADVTSIGAQTYGDAVTLAADVVLAGVGLTLSSTVDGAKSLTVNDSGTTTFSGAVGGTTALASLTTNAGGTTALNGGSVKTTGAQTYGDAVTLGADTTLTGTDPTFASGVTGNGKNLVLAFSGTTAIDGATFTGLANLTSQGGGTTTLTGSLTTTGTQTYDDAVELVGDTTLAAGSNAVTFNSTLNSGSAGAKALAVTSTGTTTFGDAVGSTAALASVTTDVGGKTAINGGSVKTTGVQTYGDAVTLGAVTLLETTNSTITFSGTLDGTTASAETLGLKAGTGNVVFGSTVGGGTRLGAITVTSAADLTAAAITASSLTHTSGTGTATFNGAQSYDTAAGLNVVTKAIVLNQSVTTTNAGVVTLNANDGGLVIAAAGDIVADAAVTLSGSTGISTAGDVTTTNDDVVYASATTLTGPIAVNTGSGAGAIAFNGTLDGPHNITLAAGTDTIDFAAAVGSKAPLGSMTLQSASGVTAASSIGLNGSAVGAGPFGLTLAAGVNAVDMQQAGSRIEAFSSHGVFFQGTSTNSTLANFTITGNGGNGILVRGGSFASSYIDSNTITANKGTGVLINGAATALGIGGNTITGNSGNGIVIAGAADAITVDGNVVSGNTVTGIRTSVQSSAAPTNVAIINNIVGLNAAGTAALANGENGIILSGDSGSLLDGNIVSGNTANGIIVTDGAKNATIQNSIIGLNAAETAAIGNGQQGIFVSNGTTTTITNVNASGNTQNGLFIGGVSNGTSVSASVFSGNARSGIVVGNNSLNTTIADSLVGVAADGLTAAGNGVSGIIIETLGTTTQVTGSTIANNKSHGIAITSGRGGQIGGTGVLANQITSNGDYGVFTSGVVGSKAAPLTVLGNTIAGNRVGLGAFSTTGLVVGPGTISGNATAGIWAEGKFTDTSISGTSIQGSGTGVRLKDATNLAVDGTNSTITLSGNINFGVLASGTLTGTTVRGMVVLEGAYGIGLSAAQGLTVSNNILLNATKAGVYATGTLTGTVVSSNTISNNLNGMIVIGTGLTIGSATGTSTVEAQGNRLSNNLGFGVVVSGAGAVNNPILSNSMYANGSGGISLSGGGNGGQVAPTVTGAAIAGSQITVTGSISGSNGDVYRVQYFSSLATDATSASRVQGRTLLGYRDVTISGGTAVIDAAFAKGSTAANDWVSTTATKLNSGTTPGNSSAFSTGVQVV